MSIIVTLKLPSILSGQINRHINKEDDSFGLQQVIIAWTWLEWCGFQIGNHWAFV